MPPTVRTAVTGRLFGGLKSDLLTACLTYARQAWGVAWLQGYRLLKKAWQQIQVDIDESGIDGQELLSWSTHT